MVSLFKQSLLYLKMAPKGMSTGLAPSVCQTCKTGKVYHSAVCVGNTEDTVEGSMCCRRLLLRVEGSICIVAVDGEGLPHQQHPSGWKSRDSVRCQRLLCRFMSTTRSHCRSAGVCKTDKTAQLPSGDALEPGVFRIQPWEATLAAFFPLAVST